jgi:hypothetical protein
VKVSTVPLDFNVSCVSWPQPNLRFAVVHYFRALVVALLDPDAAANERW